MEQFIVLNVYFYEICRNNLENPGKHYLKLASFYLKSETNNIKLVFAVKNLT